MADTGGSGLGAAQYRLQGASSWSTATGSQFTVPAPSDHSADGVHVYQYRVLDNAGNSSTIGNCTMWIDTTPPTTTPVGLAPDDLSGWRTTSQTVSMTADDGTGSGVTAISYTLDGAAAQSYSVPFVVSASGQHPVTYNAADAAGNVETVRTGWVNISNPYAQATANLAPDGQSDWQRAGDDRDHLRSRRPRADQRLLRHRRRDAPESGEQPGAVHGERRGQSPRRLLRHERPGARQRPRVRAT